MKHLTHAVPPGSVRIETKGRWSGNSLAFRRPDGARVVVCANPLPEERTLVIRDDSSEEVSAVLEPSSFHTFILK
jgi:glucosylceramidase